MTITTSATVSISSNSTSLTEARMVTVRSVSTRTRTEAGKLVCNCGSSALMRSTTAIMFAPRLALNVDDDRGLAVHPGRLLGVFSCIDDGGHVRTHAPRPRCDKPQSPAW